MTPLKRDDFEREPCTCPACVQAGMSARPQRRSPQTGAFLHGYDLVRLYAAEDNFWALAKRCRPAKRIASGSEGGRKSDESTGAD